MNKSRLICLALLVVATSAFAQDPNLSEGFSKCIKKADGVNAEVLTCIDKETKSQDVRLNAAYKELMEQLEPAQKKDLLDAQRAWLKFRAESTEVISHSYGGAFGSVNASHAFLSMTAARVADLEDLARP